jgi:F0F1-type ATP synthase assembly protein I
MIRSNGESLPLDDNIRKLILAVPPFTPCLIALPAQRMTALVLRVGSLEGLEQKGLRLQVSFAGYEHEGNHLACVVFRVFNDPESPLEGDAYLNLHQAEDRKALEYLATQDRLPFVFLSLDLRSEVEKSISWQETNRKAARQVLDNSAVNPEKVKEKFQATLEKTAGHPNSRENNQSPFLQRAGMYLGVAFELPGTILGSLVAGYFLDRYFNTSPWLLIALTLLGFAGALVRLMQWAKFFSAERDRNDRQKDDTAH